MIPSALLGKGKPYEELHYLQVQEGKTGRFFQPEKYIQGHTGYIVNFL